MSSPGPRPRPSSLPQPLFRRRPRLLAAAPAGLRGLSRAALGHPGPRRKRCAARGPYTLETLAADVGERGAVTIRRIDAGEIQMAHEFTGPETAPVVCLNHCFGAGLDYWRPHLPAFRPAGRALYRPRPLLRRFPRRADRPDLRAPLAGARRLAHARQYDLRIRRGAARALGRAGPTGAGGRHRAGARAPDVALVHGQGGGGADPRLPLHGTKDPRVPARELRRRGRGDARAPHHAAPARDRGADPRRRHAGGSGRAAQGDGDDGPPDPERPPRMAEARAPTSRAWSTRNGSTSWFAISSANNPDDRANRWRGTDIEPGRHRANRTNRFPERSNSKR